MTIVYRVGKGLYVNMTNRCPCACEFCIRRNGAGVYGSDPLWLEREPSVAEICEAVDAAVEGYTSIVFCGYGEPTGRLEDLLAVAGHIRETKPGMPIRVNTNGLADLIVGGPTASRFSGLVDCLSISLNAENAERYEAACHPVFGSRSYAAVLRFAEEARNYVPSVILTVVGTPDMTPGRISACRGIAERIGVDFRVRTFTS